MHAGSLDTNVLLRLILADDLKQNQQARRLFRQSKTWHVSLLSIAEIVYILEGKGYARGEIKQSLEVLCGLSELHLAREVIWPAAQLYSAQPSISFVDACLPFEAAANSAEPLRTFDKKLAKHAPHTKLID